MQDKIELKEREPLQSYVDRVCNMAYTMNPIEHRKAILHLAEECYNKGVADAEKHYKQLKEKKDGNI